MIFLQMVFETISTFVGLVTSFALLWYAFTTLPYYLLASAFFMAACVGVLKVVSIYYVVEKNKANEGQEN